MVKHFRVSRRDDKKIRLTHVTASSAYPQHLHTFTPKKSCLTRTFVFWPCVFALGEVSWKVSSSPNPCGNVFLAFFSRWNALKRNRWWWISMDGASSSKNIKPRVIWICIVELWISLQVQSTNMTCHHLEKLREKLRYSDIPQTHRNLLQISSLLITGTHQCIPRLVAVSDEPQRTRSNKPCRRDVARCG